MPFERDIVLNEGKKTATIVVTNKGDHPFLFTNIRSGEHVCCQEKRCRPGVILY